MESLYHRVSTAPRRITEVKPCSAGLVLGWVYGHGEMIWTNSWSKEEKALHRAGSSVTHIALEREEEKLNSPVRFPSKKVYQGFNHWKFHTAHQFCDFQSFLFGSRVQSANALLQWITSTMSRFSDFFVQTKNKCHRSIYHAEFSKYAKFHKDPLQKHENMGPQTYMLTCRWVSISYSWTRGGWEGVESGLLKSSYQGNHCLIHETRKGI